MSETMVVPWLRAPILVIMIAKLVCRDSTRLKQLLAYSPCCHSHAHIRHGRTDSLDRTVRIPLKIFRLGERTESGRDRVKPTEHAPPLAFFRHLRSLAFGRCNLALA